MNQIHLSIADIGITINANDTLHIKHLLPSYAPFSRKASDSSVDFSQIRVAIKDRIAYDEASFKPVHEFFSMDIRQEVFESEEGNMLFKLYTANGVHATTLYVPASLNDFEICLNGTDQEQAFGLNNAMMLLFTIGGIAHDTLLIHSSTVHNSGRAYSFLGTSGTGKSTHSDLWVNHIAGTKILNDDNPALRVMADGTVRIFGTPWSGKRNFYLNESYPLGGIVRLHQAPRNEIERLRPIMGFVELWASSSKLVWDRDFSNRIRQVVETICCKVPCYSLNCLPDADAARLCYDTITKDIK